MLPNYYPDVTRGLRDVIALGGFLGEKTAAENEHRDLDLAKAMASMNSDPFTWEVCAQRTKCFCVYTIDGTTFATSAYIKNLVAYCRVADSQGSSQ